MANKVKGVEIDPVREKLIKLIHHCTSCEVCHDADIADHLIDNGVTVSDGKPLEAFLHPIDAYKGLKAKYLVFKADTGRKVENCFVLRPGKDPAAVEALRAYANASDNETLTEDIYKWVGKGTPVQDLDGCEYCQQFDDPCGVPMIAEEESEADRGIYLYNGFLCANGGEFCESKVNFCPMCGRKLLEPPKTT